MAYTLDYSLSLGSAKAGIVDLRAQLVDSAGVNVGSAVSTGFAEIGGGNYLWTYAAFPDRHRGGVKFYSAAAPATVLAFAAVNPEEAEYATPEAVRAALGLAAADLDAQLGGLSTFDPANDAVTLASDGLDAVKVETGLNFRQAQSLIASALAGVLAGAGTTTITIKGAGVATTRITATVDSSGNRSVLILNPPV